MKPILDQIKQYCSSLGFDLVEAVAPEPLGHFKIYEEWLAKGYHAEMHYLSSERAVRLRHSAQEIMPTCKTILVLAYRYPPASNPQPNTLKLKPLIASYAQIEDYHTFLVPLLEKVTSFIEALSGEAINAKIFTDAGPILEREVACTAGLGWIGKNSCLINPRFGSYFFLAEILLDIQLRKEEETSFPLPDRCGNCRRCIDSCPTHCIKENRTIDARNCIAYLTIENRGKIPFELRESIGMNLFGCDVCQQVCPWNQKLPLINHPPGCVDSFPMIMDIVNNSSILDEREFNQKFASSPISRAKRRGFYRNLAVVLGNLHNKATIPLLKQLMADTDSLVRQHAAWALGRFSSQHAEEILQAALAIEQDQIVIKEIRQALETKKNPLL